MKIFINYRRDDEANIVFAIANSLMKEFGVENVFFDKQAIKAGSEFPKEIDKALDSCRVFIAVIGRKWLDIMNKRRALDENDYVLNEIEQAMDKGVFILPVLVDHTHMPSEKDLPPALRGLSYINAVNISSDPKHLPSDIRLLTVELNDIFSRIPQKPKPKPKPGPGPIRPGLKRMGWILSSIIIIAVLAVLVISKIRNHPMEGEQAFQEREQPELFQSKQESSKSEESQVADIEESDKKGQKHLAQENVVQENEQDNLKQTETNIGKKGLVVDIDGNNYQTVKIGDQVWMAENLKVTHYNNYDPIPNVTDSAQWISLRTGAYCSYDNLAENAEIYGHLYNAFAIMDQRGLCPAGWHVPSKDEFKILLDTLGGWEIAGGMLKESGWSHWEVPNTGANNRTGFTALPGGNRTKKGFRNKQWYCYLWSSSISGSWWLHLTLGLHNTEAHISNMLEPWNGESVRCIED